MKTCIILAIGLVVSLQTRSQELQKINTPDLKKMVQRDDAVYVINFWATWCQPCRDELPSVLKIASEFAGQNVKVILVSLDYPDAYPKKIRNFMDQYAIHVPVFWLNETNPRAIAAAVYPQWKGMIPFTIFLNLKKGYSHIIEQEIPADDWAIELEKAL